jgi:hypothetical protein
MSRSYAFASIMNGSEDDFLPPFPDKGNDCKIFGLTAPIRIDVHSLRSRRVAVS